MASEWDVTPKEIKVRLGAPAKVKPQATIAVAASLVVVFGLGALLGRLTVPSLKQPVVNVTEQSVAAATPAVQNPTSVSNVGIVRFSATFAPKDQTTREAQALRLLHNGSLADWKTTPKDIRLLMCIYFAARFTSKDEPDVSTLARAATVGDYLDGLADENVGSRKDTVAYLLAMFHAMHVSGNDLKPRD